VNEASSIGESLRVARERMGLDLDQAAERLHVDTNVIQSLETGKFKALGAPVFVRGHLRHYCELLGEPEDQLQQRYAALQEASVPPDLTAVPHLPTQPTRAPRTRWPLVALALVLVVAVTVWWAMGVKTV
jgi:cytoskeleton protein RodZ